VDGPHSLLPLVFSGGLKESGIIASLYSRRNLLD
jgi:hypothetical protein